MTIETLGLGESLEKDIVSLCIHDVKFFLDVTQYLKPQHFVSETMGKAYAVIQGYFDVYHTVPKVDIIKYQLKKLGIDSDGVELPRDILNRDFLLSETVKLVRNQEMKRYVLSAIGEIEKGDKANYEKLESELRSVLNIQPEHDLGTIYFDVDERFAKLHAAQTERIPTGIPFVDHSLNGGLGRKELTCFAAAPGVGKSFMLAICGAHILKTGHNIVHYTLEMSEELTALRYDCALLTMSSKDILADEKRAKERINAHKKIISENLVIKEFPTKGATINTLRAHLSKLKEQRNFIPDLITVDYGDIMKATRSYDKRYDEQGAVFQELRGLAQEMNVAVLSATQTNRGSMSKEIATMEDLGDSFDKARIMDALFMILQKPDEKEDGLFRMYSAKVRNGVGGRLFGFEINYETATIREVGETQANHDDKDKDK